MDCRLIPPLNALKSCSPTMATWMARLSTDHGDHEDPAWFPESKLVGLRKMDDFLVGG